MSVNPVKRKLAAILAADAVGYSRLMAADEEGTMRVLQAHRSVIDGIIQFHEGRIVNTAGDSVLAEFASPTQAVRCAVEIQDALKTRNDALPEAQRLHFRIGVNLGDVMVKGDDLLGDGVNVAARLEGIAEPGNIYVSSSVYDQIAGKLDLGFVDLGEQSLKNIDRPIRTYRVERDGRRTKPRPARRAGAGAGQWIAVGLALAAAAGGAAWFLAQQATQRDKEQAQATAQAEAARARADAEVARAKAEADEARKRAETATATADAARRQLDEQRVAESRARAQAELATARAEAEATRRKADAELASAEAARKAAEAAAKPAPRPAAPAPAPSASVTRWAGHFMCGPFESSPATAIPAAASALGAAFDVTAGAAGRPGSIHVSGTRMPDGALRLSGSGISSRPEALGRSYAAEFTGKFVSGHYEGRGTLGTRDCALVFRTEEEFQARIERQRQGADLLGTIACGAYGKAGPGMQVAKVVVSGSTYELRHGKKGEPGSLRMRGVRGADGKMSMTGSGHSGLEEHWGQSFVARFDGSFEDEHFEGRGRLGGRECALVIARP